MKARNYLCFFSLIFSIHTVQAAQYVNLNNLLKLSEEYLQENLYKTLPPRDHTNVIIESRPIDPRLKLFECAKSLTFAHRLSSALKGHVSVRVSCPSEKSWAIYTKHHISLEKDVVVLTRNLVKGQKVTASDLGYIRKNIYKLRPGYAIEKEEVIGKLVTRAHKPGDMIYTSRLALPHLIRKGDAVNVIARIGLLSVMTPGIALKDGHKGEQIDVENRHSARIIRAEVVGPNTVSVIL